MRGHGIPRPISPRDAECPAPRVRAIPRALRAAGLPPEAKLAHVLSRDPAMVGAAAQRFQRRRSRSWYAMAPPAPARGRGPPAGVVRAKVCSLAIAAAQPVASQCAWADGHAPAPHCIEGQGREGRGRSPAGVGGAGLWPVVQTVGPGREHNRAEVLHDTQLNEPRRS
jgi:hypothetical protein